MTTKGQHTPGPWIHDQDSVGIYSPSSGHDICYLNSDPDAGDREANACLIAAAPEMLAFIKSLVHLTGADALTQSALLAKIEGK